MTTEQLRAVRDASPFRPFTLQLADGRAYRIPHRDFLSMHPGGRTAIVYEGTDAFNIVDVMLVNDLKVDPSPSVVSSAATPTDPNAPPPTRHLN